eukprot:m.74999 g.74999  ORF g.74999 m.74999 type:complete len:55 (+) comp12429_c0_seq1:925-1089(+)
MTPTANDKVWMDWWVSGMVMATPSAMYGLGELAECMLACNLTFAQIRSQETFLV